MKDVMSFVQKCDQCQRFVKIQEKSSMLIIQILIPWSFDMWGIDILGPFPMAAGQRKFLLIAINYFTKWIEAEPLTHITEKKIQDFVWKSIIYHFGLPRYIISDNSK